jgi:hypothetical protein
LTWHITHLLPFWFEWVLDNVPPWGKRYKANRSYQRLCAGYCFGLSETEAAVNSARLRERQKVGGVLLRFAQTTDREFAVENEGGQLIGTLALLDLVLTER